MTTRHQSRRAASASGGARTSEPRGVDLNRLRVFVEVARAQGFTRAAGRLGLDKARVSRVVAALEQELGVALLARSTRSVRLTAEGAALLQRVEPALGELVAAVRPMGAARPAGLVTITATPEVARALLAPALAAFRLRHPEVRVKLVAVEAVADLLREGIDLALRVGRPGAGGLIARRLCDLEAGFFAAPSYLERRGVPQSPADLAAHDGLWPAPRRGQQAFQLGATGAGAGPAPPTAAISCGDFDVLAALARAGAGIAVLPTLVAADDLASGRLVRVLPRLALGAARLYLVSRPERPAPARVAALRAFLLEALRSPG